MAGEYIEFNNNTQPAVNDTNLNRLQQLIKQDIVGTIGGDTLPVGAIVIFGSETIPENWLLCNGQAVSRTTYQDLFNTIGITFGQGDGFTTFNLPNLNQQQIYIIKAKQSAGVVATVVDGLTSTSATDALSAKQGKVLNEKIEGEVIYNNTAGANDNIVLSKNVSNFTRLKIFYATSIGNYFIRESKEFLVTDGCDVSLSVLAAHSASLQINTIGRYHISGTSITKVFETATRFGSANDYNWEGQTSRILISKVIGY